MRPGSTSSAVAGDHICPKELALQRLASFEIGSIRTTSPSASTHSPTTLSTVHGMSLPTVTMLCSISINEARCSTWKRRQERAREPARVL